MQNFEADAAETRLNRLLNMILETAVEVVGYDSATVTARHGGSYSTIAATDQRFTALDEAQYESEAGPCLDVLDGAGPLTISNMAEDRRWPHFAETAHHMGVVSSLSVHVPVDVDDIGASLNFYARTAADIDDKRLRVAQGYADQVAAAMLSIDAYKATAALARGLAGAMDSRAVIEQAKGMLMAEFGVSADEAFARLASLSQNRNVKLRDVATDLVDERARPREQPDG